MNWISVKDMLPERLQNKTYSQVPCIANKRYSRTLKDGTVKYWYNIEILVFNHEHECWDDEDGDDYNCDIDNVTHWMPLPEPPQNEQK